MKHHNLANRFRQERMRKFLELVPMDRPVHILDLGGTAHYWHALPSLYGLDRVSITILNLDVEELQDANLTVRRGNACAVDFPDMSFDIVHSNSVIEHVGPWEDMKKMAAEVRRLAPMYFVQTPNFWFPLEPHFKLPFVQFLPLRTRGRVLDMLDRLPSNDGSDGLTEASRIRLLSPRQIGSLFPDAHLWRERFMGLTKSIVAIKMR